MVALWGRYLYSCFRGVFSLCEWSDVCWGHASLYIENVIHITTKDYRISQNLYSLPFSISHVQNTRPGCQIRPLAKSYSIQGCILTLTLLYIQGCILTLTLCYIQGCILTLLYLQGCILRISGPLSAAAFYLFSATNLLRRIHSDSWFSIGNVVTSSSNSRGSHTIHLKLPCKQPTKN